MDRVLKLSDIAPVSAPKNVIGFEESDADELVHQRIPFALQTGFVGFGEGFLQHGEGPAFSEGERGIALFEIACHLRPEGFELVLCSGFSGGCEARDAVDVGGIGAPDVFDQARFTRGVERLNGVDAALFDHTGEATVVLPAGIGRYGNTGVEFPRLELMAAQISNRLEARVQAMVERRLDRLCTRASLDEASQLQRPLLLLRL